MLAMLDGMMLGASLVVILILGWKFISHRWPVVPSDLHKGMDMVNAELQRLHGDLNSVPGELQESDKAAMSEISKLNDSMKSMVEKAKASTKAEEVKAIDAVQSKVDQAAADLKK